MGAGFLDMVIQRLSNDHAPEFSGGEILNLMRGIQCRQTLCIQVIGTEAILTAPGREKFLGFHPLGEELMQAK